MQQVMFFLNDQAASLCTYTNDFNTEDILPEKLRGNNNGSDSDKFFFPNNKLK